MRAAFVLLALACAGATDHEGIGVATATATRLSLTSELRYRGKLIRGEGQDQDGQRSEWTIETAAVPEAVGDRETESGDAEPEPGGAGGATEADASSQWILDSISRAGTAVLDGAIATCTEVLSGPGSPGGTGSHSGQTGGA